MRPSPASARNTAAASPENGARYAWGNFVTLTGDQLFNAVRDAIESLYELPGLTETGKLLFNRATLKIYDRPTLRAVVQAIHKLDMTAHNGHDVKGDMYEYLLSKTRPCPAPTGSSALRDTSLTSSSRW